jgi:hypothetical protein
LLLWGYDRLREWDLFDLLKLGRIWQFDWCSFRLWLEILFIAIIICTCKEARDFLSRFIISLWRHYRSVWFLQWSRLDFRGRFGL